MNFKNTRAWLSQTGRFAISQIPKRLKNSRVQLLLLCLTLIAINVIYATSYLRDDYFIPEDIKSILSEFTQTSKKIVIFPKNCRLRNDELAFYYENNLHHDLSADDIIFKNRLPNKLKNVSCKQTTMEIFETSRKSTCTASSIPFEVSSPYNMNANLYKILAQFVHKDSEYYQEMRPFFPGLLRQIRDRTIENNWFQMIGSSVWLEQYGVHLMISRVFYSKTGDKVKPVMSLSYVQIYDREWNELDNIDLVVPNECAGKNGEPEYKVISYPNFLPMPVYHNVGQQKGRFYGVEDPRILLVKNKNGYEEPIIIFNSHNRKISQVRSFKDLWSTVSLDMYRSMFIGWLWRSQTGKANVDEVLDRSHVKDTYVKVKELKLPPESETRKKEKNWTPFIDYEHRRTAGYDINLKLIYQFQDLKILSCSLDPREVMCNWEYQRNEENPSDIKRLRGGTELISINELLDESHFDELDKFKKTIKSANKQLWIGFARVVLKNCGCGVKMYRPNLVVLIKDNKGYSFSIVSSFMDLDVPILPWSNNDLICTGKNLLVPNGISSWVFARDDLGKLKDHLTLTLSRSDATVDVLFVKGVLRQLLTEVIIPSPKVKNDNNVKCAIKSSKEFCEVYAEHAQIDYEEHMKYLASDFLERMNNVPTTDENNQQFDAINDDHS